MAGTFPRDASQHAHPLPVERTIFDSDNDPRFLFSTLSNRLTLDSGATLLPTPNAHSADFGPPSAVLVV